MNDLAPQSLLTNRALVLGGDTRYGYVLSEADRQLLLGVLQPDLARLMETVRRLQQVNSNLNAELLAVREKVKALSESAQAERIRELEAQVMVLSKVIVDGANQTKLVLDLLASKGAEASALNSRLPTTQAKLEAAYERE